MGSRLVIICCCQGRLIGIGMKLEEQELSSSPGSIGKGSRSSMHGLIGIGIGQHYLVSR